MVRRSRTRRGPRHLWLVPLFGALSFVGVLTVRPAAAATVTKVAAAICVDDAGVGTIAWANAAGAETSNNAYATAGLSNSDVSHYLKCTGFGFAIIPPGATIQGIQVAWEKKSSGNRTSDNAIRIVKGGAIGTVDKSAATDWATSDVVATYGGAADLWGTTWTAADINAATFGAALSAKQGNANRTASVDAVTITITYDPCTGVANGTACDDGNACTQTDTCQSGVCTGANPVVCTASDQCHTVGVCNTGTGVCSNPAAPNGTSCSDGNACTQTDTCQTGVCSGSNPVVCTASDQCHTAGTCNTGTGVCSNPAKPNGSACNDGNACTQSDTCQSAVCTGANPVVCTASDQCHVAGTCNTGTGVCSNPAKADGTGCNDGNACTSGDSCTGGTCGGPPVVCNDGNACTTDTCAPATGCVFTNNTGPCEDGNLCTQNDTCSGGTCHAGSAVVCAASDQCHNAGVCSPATGCSNPQKADGTSCNDGDICTQPDSCQAGICLGGSSVCFSDEIFVSNYAANTITVYARSTNGDVAPTRTIRTGLNKPHSLGVDLLHRDLFVPNNLLASDGPAVNVYDLNANNPGNDLPQRTISGPLTLLNRPAGIAVDPINQELYVANDLDSGSSINVFSLSANGNVSPIRTLALSPSGIEGPLGMAIDLVHDELLVANYKVAGEGSITAFPRTASGSTPPLRTIQGPTTGFNRPQGIAVDLAHDEIVVANSFWGSSSPGNIQFFSRTAVGDVPPIRQIAGAATALCNPIGLYLDRVNDEIVVANSHASSASCALNVATYARTASGNAAPLRLIGPGPNSALLNSEGVTVTTNVDCADPLVADGTPCNDGNVCTLTDLCQGGVCTGSGSVVCTASDQCHNAGVCDSVTGCSNPAKSNGTACNDGSACTQTDTCQTGVCTGGNPVVCTASDLCHTPGTCDGATGSCAGETPIVCTALDQCHTAGVCSPATGCSNPAKANGTPCSDGNSCTQSDTCQSGACISGNLICGPQEVFVSNFSSNTIEVFPRTTNGDVAPVRTIQNGLDHPHTLGLDLLHQELFVSNDLADPSLAAVRVYDLGASSPGNDSPKRTIQGALTLLERPAGLAVDSVHQELFVGNDLDSGSSINVFSLASNGNVAPIRTLQGALTGIEGPLGIAVDLVHNELIVVSYKVADGGSVTFFPRTATGNVPPLRTIQGPLTGFNRPQGLTLDLARDEIVVANSYFDNTTSLGKLLIFPRTGSGNLAPIREISGAGAGLCNPIGVMLDPVNGEFVVANSHFSASDCAESVSVYPETGSVVTSPIRQIGPGPLSTLNHCTSVAVKTNVNCSDAAVASGTPCDDGSACTTADVCQAGACTGSLLDADQDGACDLLDCAPNDAGAFAVPAEATGFIIASDKTTLSWNSLIPAAGTATLHEVLRGQLAGFPVGSHPSEICINATPSVPTATDVDIPAAGSGFWYLVRGHNVCGAGPYGFATGGGQETSSVCP